MGADPAFALRAEPQEGLVAARFNPGEGAPYRVLSLFAGIGGFDLGLERTGGFKTVAFCEIDPFCQKVLAKHWPGVPIYDDVRTLTAEQVGPIDVICGGFPCQDLSFAGKGAGLAGERSGLWSEYARLVGELRPAYVIVENVAALLSRGLGTVLGDLAALGYDAEWHCIPASAVGAPHRRDRLWLVAYPASERRGEARRDRERPAQRAAGGGKILADATLGGRGQRGTRRLDPSGSGQLEQPFPNVADAERGRLEGWNEQRAWPTAIVAPAYRRHRGGSEFGQAWRVEPDVGRVAHGVPDGMDRLKSLGNAVVPDIPEIIGRAILSCDSGRLPKGEAGTAECGASQSGGGTPHRPDSTVALPLLHTMKDLRHG